MPIAAPVDFNIPHHAGSEAVFSAKHAQLAGGRDALNIAAAPDDC